MDAVRTPLRIAAAGAAVLILSLFLPWYGASVEALGVSASVTGWQSFALIDIILLLLAAAALFAVWSVADRNEDRLPLPAATIVTALGILAAVLVFYRFLDLPADGLERRYGLFLALASSLAIAGGGWAAMREQNQSFGDARADLEDRVNTARSDAARAIEGDSSSSRYDQMTKEELYEEAQKRGIEGRADMDKDELAQALRRRG